MTKTTSKRNHGPVLVAALTVLGASLGVSTPAGAAETTGLFLKGHDATTSRQHKGEVTSHAIKGETPASTQIKGETSSKQFKFWAPSSPQIKGETTSNQYKELPASNQHKGQAPSAMFLKHNVAPVSKQHKIDVHSNQIKLDTPN